MPGKPESNLSTISTRSICIGLGLVILLSVITPYVEMVIAGTQIGSICPTAGEFFLLVCLALGVLVYEAGGRICDIIRRVVKMKAEQMKSVLSILVCFYISVVSVLAAGVDENTMAIWLFNETGGDTIEDLSGRGHDLKVEGGHKWVSGRFGNALHFDQDAFVEYESHPDLSFENGLTIELWLNLEDIAPQNVVGIPRKEDEYVLAAYEQGDGFYMGPWVNNGAWIGPAISEAVVPYGEWHHHAMTYDGDELKVYADGELTGSMEIPGPMNSTDAPFRISNSCCGGRFFVGAIDEMRMSNVARTEAEIKDTMERGLESILPVEPSGGLPSMWGRIKSKL